MLMPHQPEAERRSCADCKFRVAQDTSPVGKDEKFAEMHHRTRALTATDHAEVGLESIEIGEENDACLIVLGGGREDVAGERYGGRE